MARKAQTPIDPGVVEYWPRLTQIARMNMGVVPSVQRSQVSQAWPISLLVMLVVAGVIWLTHSLRPPIAPIEQGQGAAYPEVLLEAPLQGQPVTLPKHLCKPSNDACYAHYEFRIAPEQLGMGSVSLFFPGSFGALGVRVNGVWLTPDSTLQTPLQRLMFDPRLISVSSQALAARTGPNHVLGVIVGTPPNVYEWLAPFYIGPTTLLQAPWQLSHFLAQSVLVVSNGIYLILLLLALLVYRLAGSDPLFLWFGLLVTCALFRNAFFVWVDAELLFPMAVVYHLSTNLLALSSLAFVSTLVGVGHQKGLVWLVSLGVPVTFMAISALVIIPQAGEMYANNVTQIVVAVVTLMTVRRLLQYFGSPWSTTKSWVLGCFIGSALFVAHDIVSISLLKQNVPAQLSSLSPLMVVIAFCVVLANRLGLAFNRSRDQNRLLEAAVHQREQDLFAAYAQLREAERTKTVKDERQRMMRDLHDGVGGQLASLAITARRTSTPEFAAKIEESLVDLRTVVDYVDDDRQVPLSEFLQGFKARVSSWVGAQDLLQEWTGNAWQCEHPVDAQWRLHTSRILQEGIANLLRHAEASKFLVQVNVVDQSLEAQLVDDGVGIDSGATRDKPNLGPAGRGLENMRSRAVELGGSLDFGHLPSGGTCVSFRLPLNVGADPGV